MKNWMALLLACLLCLCAVGAMAETVERVELILGNGRIRLYPDGYAQRWFDDFHPHDAATTQYVITGSKEADTLLDIYLVPKGQEYATKDVVYNISFYNASLTAYDSCTAIRIGNDENDKANGHTITLNLSNHGNSLVQAHNHPAISSLIDNVTVNIHNQSGCLKLQDRSGQNGAFRDNITINVAGGKVTDGTINWTFENTGESLTPVNSLEPTCDTDGNLEYWTCDKCHMYFLDEYAERITTFDGVRLLAPGHALQKVEAKDPTCTEDGNKEYYICTREGCGRLFRDANGTQELTADDVRLPAVHDLEKVQRREPTYEQEGSIEHYRCTKCSKLFSDANGTKELTADEVILPMLVRTDDLPQTGDSSHLPGWAALLGACCAGLWCLRRRG